MEHLKTDNLDNIFLEVSKRPAGGDYFYRINAWSAEIDAFLRRYYEAARLSGVVIEGKIPNPDEKNLAYYQEMLGNDFQMSLGFFMDRLGRWLPQMDEAQRRNVASAIYDSLDGLRRQGKNENMLKNAYVKYMCWLYYKFARIMHALGRDTLPKILYEGNISQYELLMFQVLSLAGCDIVLLQYQGDEGYRKLDPASAISDAWNVPGGKPFPDGFTLKRMREEMRAAEDRQRLYGPAPSYINGTNTWLEGTGITDFEKPVGERGSNPKIFYNCFYRIFGAENKMTYENTLFQLGQNLLSQKRSLVTIDQRINPPTPDEIAEVVRNNSYAGPEQMLQHIARNLQYSENPELSKEMVKAFLDVMLEEAGRADSNLHKLTNQAVYLVCWMKRYRKQLFTGWSFPKVAAFYHLGGCRQESEALFLRMLARLPVDVVIFVPDLSDSCCLKDSLLYEIRYEDSIQLEHFPRSAGTAQIGTVAYHAERELDELMYQDTGMYRNMQYSRATTVNLKTMYEEIAILWDQELKYRPGFQTTDRVVELPVIFAKVCGVKDGNVNQYWKDVAGLITEDTFVVRRVPLIASTEPNPMKAYAPEFFRNGKLQRSRIKDNRQYPYGVLRPEIQEYMLDKLQLLIDQKRIRGTFENGMEYTIIATVLNLPKEILRMIQKFDFTKKNPKLVYINTTEEPISNEDTILVSYLNLIGFDVVFFVPTGYQTIERYLNASVMEEHQIGTYVYDLQIPDLTAYAEAARHKTWRDRIFKRGV